MDLQKEGARRRRPRRCSRARGAGRAGAPASRCRSDRSAPHRAGRAAGMLDQLDDYLLPRLRRLDAPLLAVVGGSDRRRQVDAGQLPGRRAGHPRRGAAADDPVAGARLPPGRRRVVRDQRILPDLARAHRRRPRAGARTRPRHQRRLATSARCRPASPCSTRPTSTRSSTPTASSPPSCSPPPTCGCSSPPPPATPTPCRGSCCAPPSTRGTAVAIVLDRVPPDAMAEVARAPRARCCASAASATRRCSSCPRRTPVDDGLLPPQARSTPLRDVARRAGRRRPRRAPRSCATRSTARSPASRRACPVLAAAADAQAEAAAPAARARSLTAYERGRPAARAGRCTDGSLLRGEVLARWQEFVGTGEIIRGLESAVGRLRDRHRRAPSPDVPRPAEPLGEALESGVEALVRAAADDAAERAARGWRDDPAGAALLRRARSDSAGCRRLRRAARSALVRDWQGGVLELVREQGAGQARPRPASCRSASTALGLSC